MEQGELPDSRELRALGILRTEVKPELKGTCRSARSLGHIFLIFLNGDGCKAPDKFYCINITFGNIQRGPFKFGKYRTWPELLQRGL
jgi:hypothetical protein